MSYSTEEIGKYLIPLLNENIPYQFVENTGFSIISKYCHELNLPKPSIIAGNIVIGDIENCDYLLTSHLDEASFGFIGIGRNGGWLSPYHKFTASNEQIDITILGVRDNNVVNVGLGKIEQRNGKPFCVTKSPIKLGDRAVYYYPAAIKDGIITGKAIDDRTGVLISLLTLKDLLQKEVSVAIVLSDGEDHIPEGYFSRNFPQILHKLKDKTKICFIDGIYKDSLEIAGYKKLPTEALVIAHSSYGKGYIVPPLIFAKLRDELIPSARSNGITVNICDAYYSRGDDWGLVTNPVIGKNITGFFVSFGAWGDVHTVPMSIHSESIINCIKFIQFVIEQNRF